MRLRLRGGQGRVRARGVRVGATGDVSHVGGSILQCRNFVGIELKDTYFDAACKHLRIAEEDRKQKDRTLF